MDGPLADNAFSATGPALSSSQNPAPNSDPRFFPRDVCLGTAISALVKSRSDVENMAVLVKSSGSDVFLVTVEQTSTSDTVAFTLDGSMQLATFVASLHNGRVCAWVHNHLEGFAGALPSNLDAAQQCALQGEGNENPVACLIHHNGSVYQYVLSDVGVASVRGKVRQRLRNETGTGTEDPGAGPWERACATPRREWQTCACACKAGEQRDNPK